MSRAAYVVSACLAVVAGIAALLGLLVPGLYTDPTPLAAMLRGYDLVTLVVVVPVLVTAQWWTRRGSTRAALVWAGMLAYLPYTYAYHLFATSFNDAFLLHAAVFGGSAVALVLLAPDLVRRGGGPARRWPEWTVSAVLGLLAAGLAGMWVFSSVRVAVTGELPAGSALVEAEHVVHLGIALDLAVLVPAYLLAAVLLWRGSTAGPALAAAVLLSGILQQTGYVTALLFQAAADVPGAVAFDPAEPVIVTLYLAATVLLLQQAGRHCGQATVRLTGR